METLDKRNLDFDKRLKILMNLLQEVPVNYADSFKEDIYLQIGDLKFDQLESLILSKLLTEERIKNWVATLTSRIVMNEDRAGVNEIIWDYIYRG